MADNNSSTEAFPTSHTIPSLLKYWSETDPQTSAFKFVGEKEDIVLSRRDVYTKAGKMASILKHIGACKGDVVAMVMRDGVNCPDKLICMLGIQMAGCVSLDAFGFLKSGVDSISALAETNTKILITDEPSLLTEDKFSTLRSSQYGIDIDCPDLPTLKHIMFTPTRAGESLEVQLNKEEDIYMEHVSPDDGAVIFATSGTTDKRKLVPQNHNFVLSCTKLMLQHITGKDYLYLYNDRCFSWQPGFPSFFLCSGLTRVLRNQTDKLAPSTLDVIEKEKCHTAFLSANDVHVIYKKFRSLDRPEPLLDTVLMGGQPLNKSIVKEAKSISRCLVNIYASTECGPITSLLIDQKLKYEDFSAGHPFLDTELKIVDEEGEGLQSGQKGEIYVRGPNVTTGCLTTNGISRKAYTSDGWFKTGDVGSIDSTGMLVVEGRGSDVIMRGDELIYPLSVEQMLRECPAVEDVVVVGVPDPVMHHEMCVFVQGAEGFDDPISDLKAYLSDKFLSFENKEYDRFPKYYLLCDSFPKNKNGKIIRRQMIASAKLKLNL